MKKLANLTRQSTTLNLSNNNSIYKQSLFKILLLTVFALFPIFLIILFNFNKSQERKTLEKRESVEKIVSSSLISSSKYGDLVYARAQSLELGKGFGLMDLGICIKDQDIFERPHEKRCKNEASNIEEISTNSAILDGQEYSLEFHWKKEKQSLFQQAIFSIILSFLMAIFFFLPLQFFLLSFILTKVKETMTYLIEDKIKTPNKLVNEKLKNDFTIPNEFTALSEFIQTKTDNLRNATKDIVTMDMAKQVSHDIRSPLAALMMAIDDVDKTISTSQKNMIYSSVRRINDIANNLLNSRATNEISSEIRTELLGPIIDSLVSEKRMQYRDNLNINIKFDLNESFGLFSNVNVVELKRSLSNLINNSIEAIVSKGTVSINIFETKDKKICLSIVDNGSGMSEDVLNKLGEKGFSYGKRGSDSGSGLGFFHAKKMIESLGGALEIESHLGQGTSIKIFLNKAIGPNWFLERLILPKNKKILILDDDESMLHAWSERIHLQSHLFTSGEEFANAINLIRADEFIAFIDYELLGQVKNGIDLIKSLGIAEQSFLVTSRFEEKELQEACNKLGVKIIPKTMVSIIPIEIVDATNDTYDYVYIDDDELMRISWERKAIKQKIKLLTLSSTDDFASHIDKIKKEYTNIYIDSELGINKIKGEDFALILHNNGYQHLFIASGYSAEQFSNLSWLQFAGKKCPF